MANRICALCKKSGDMNEMEKLGKKDFICSDRISCYTRKLKGAEQGS